MIIDSSKIKSVNLECTLILFFKFSYLLAAIFCISFFSNLTDVSEFAILESVRIGWTMAAVCFQERSQNSARMQISRQFFVPSTAESEFAPPMLVCRARAACGSRVSGSRPGTTPRPRTRPFGHHAAANSVHLCESASAHRVLHQHAGRDLQRTAFDFWEPTLRKTCSISAAPERCCRKHHERQIYLLRKFCVLRVTRGAYQHHAESRRCTHVTAALSSIMPILLILPFESARGRRTHTHTHTHVCVQKCCCVHQQLKLLLPKQLSAFSVFRARRYTFVCCLSGTFLRVLGRSFKCCRDMCGGDNCMQARWKSVMYF